MNHWPKYYEGRANFTISEYMVRIRINPSGPSALIIMQRPFPALRELPNGPSFTARHEGERRRHTIFLGNLVATTMNRLAASGINIVFIVFGVSVPQTKC